MPRLELWLPAALFCAELLLFLWLGRLLAQKLVRRNFNHELTEKDNLAAGLAAGGYHLGLFFALAGLLAGGPEWREQHWRETIARDALMIAFHGAAAMLALVLSAAFWRMLFGLRIQEHIFEGRNAAAGLIAGAALLATGFIYHGATQGEGPFASAVVFFLLGQGAFFATSFLYERITPFDVHTEICEKANPAAAAAKAGALLASGIIVGHAASGDFTSWDESLRDFALFLIPLAALPLARFFVARGILLGFRDLNREIVEDRNVAAGILEGAAYIGIAVFLVTLI